MKKFVGSILCMLLIGMDAVAVTKVQESAGKVVLDNGKVSVSVDLKHGVYSVKNLQTQTDIFTDASLMVDGWNTRKPGGKKLKTGGIFANPTIKYHVTDLADLGERGKAIVLTVKDGVRQFVEYMFKIALPDEGSFVLYQAGVNNVSKADYRLADVSFFSLAGVFPGTKKLDDLKSLNGAAGAVETSVWGDKDRVSENSLLLTAEIEGKHLALIYGGLRYQYFYALSSYSKKGRMVELRMTDPYGKLVPAGNKMWMPEVFCLGIGTDPFDMAESYGAMLAKYSKAAPNAYNFLTLCGWAVGSLSGMKSINNSKALVEQMDIADKSGITQYTPVAVRLEPDTYCGKKGGMTEQGWWDDEHWRKFKHLVPPYDTFAKWCDAVRKKGGIPLTYFQCNMPSDDFAQAHPDWMLGGDLTRLGHFHRHALPWVRMDYSHPGFRAHMQNVWKNLHDAGIAGIKFDYPETNWNVPAVGSGFNDKAATTTSTYRALFELCREGLGPDALIHERALAVNDRPALDVCAGVVDIQRSEKDNNKYLATHVSKVGLRWYKNRNVFLYYPDSKAVHNLDETTLRSLVTMLGFTSGRLEVATPFEKLTPEIVKDLSRMYPIYEGKVSPRPVDAFTGVRDPRIYDWNMGDDKHIVALFNPESKAKDIQVRLDMSNLEGGLQLDANATYHVYDFWGDRYVGKLKGNAQIGSMLKPMACALYAVCKAGNVPQLVSTNRHITQGAVDVKQLSWKGGKLSGSCKVVAGDPYMLVVAQNGWKNKDVKVNNPKVNAKKIKSADGLDYIELSSSEDVEVDWSIAYASK